MSALIPILREGDPRLRLPAQPVTRLEPDEVARLKAALAQFRAAHGFGRAIAANQIGVLRRMIAVDLGAGPFLVANPEITWRSDERFELWDDCMSVPDRLVRVQRHRSISLRYLDERLRPRTWERLPPELAELLQHEIDHLDGVLMVDRATGPEPVRPLAERAALAPPPPAPRLSLANIARAPASIDPVFRDSPQLEYEPLSAALGCRLIAKAELLNPIRCFKGRGAQTFVAALSDAPDAARVVCASAGNFGQAMALACRARGIPITVFAARTANALKLERMRELGAEVRLAGHDVDSSKAAAREHARATGARMVEDGLDPEIAEGAGTIGLELLARGDALHDVVLPIGNGALAAGVGRWIKAASPATRILGVCAAGAPAMAESWRRAPGQPMVERAVDTIADGIAIRVPIPEAIGDLHGVLDDVVLVSDAAIVLAMRLLHEQLGVAVEPAGAVALAAIQADRARFAGRTVATVLTGGNISAEAFRALVG